MEEPKYSTFFVFLSFHRYRSGIDAVLCLECPVKAGIVRESAGATDLPCRHAGAEQLSCHQQAAQCNVAVQTDAHFPGKGMGKVILTDEEAFCQTIQCQFLVNMTTNMVQDPVY